VNAVNVGAKLTVPDMRFNRKIGSHSGKHFATDGRELSAAEWAIYQPTVLPSEADEIVLADSFKNPNWIAIKGRLDGEAA